MRYVVFFLAGWLLLAAHASAQVTREEFEALKSEVGTLREAIRAQSEVLKQLLARGGTPFKETLVSIDGAASYGSADARVIVVEFSDYQCPFCARYATDTFPLLERDYIKSGRVKYVFRDYPVESSHPQAFKAHEAVHCAADQGKRREMHDRVFSNQRTMRLEHLTAHAEALKLDKALFERCLTAGSHAARIRSAIAAGHEAGVRGTPTFFVGFAEPDGSKIRAIRRIVGAQPYAAFKAAIDEVLSAK